MENDKIYRDHLKILDTILNRIFGDGENLARRNFIFSGNVGTEVTITNDNDPWKEGLRFLVAEGYVRQSGDSFSLTTKGILRLSTNSFLNEYQKEKRKSVLLMRDLKWKITYNVVILIISLIGLGLSVYNFITGLK